MPHKRLDLDECPVPSCDAPVHKAFKTTQGAKLTTGNMIQERTCLYPTTFEMEADDGPRPVPATILVYHHELEDADSEAVSDTSSDPAPDDLPDDHRTVYQTLVERAPATKAELAGALAGSVDLDTAGAALDALVADGYVEEVDGGFAPT